MRTCGESTSVARYVLLWCWVWYSIPKVAFDRCDSMPSIAFSSLFLLLHRPTQRLFVGIDVCVVMERDFLPSRILYTAINLSLAPTIAEKQGSSKVSFYEGKHQTFCRWEICKWCDATQTTIEYELRGGDHQWMESLLSATNLLG